MFHRNALLLVAGASMFALNASAVSAQDTTRTKRTTSSRRIPIAKESPGEVAPRVDTVTVYRTDTLRLQGRVDTVRTTNTVTRIDTVVQTVNLTPKMIGGLYFGLAGGVAIPSGAIRTVNNTGALAQFQVGWQGLKTWLGARFDGSYTQYSENSNYANLGAKPDLWNFNLDLKLDIPVGAHWFGGGAQFAPYLIGGGSYVYYRNLRMELEEGLRGGFGPQNALVAGGANNWEHNWGWNAGGGLGWHIGRSEVFVESRAIYFKRGSDDNTNSVCGSSCFGKSWHVPIAFGVNVY